MSVSEFSGLGLVPGAVRGLRAFNVDALGRLIGVSYPQVWSPGENVATCENPKPRRWWQFKPQHSMLDCSCGFYAFYEGSNTYRLDEVQESGTSFSLSIGGYISYSYPKPRVSAVVEGYGEAVIGTKGFRSAKARIVAIYIPKGVEAALADRVRRNYSSTPQFEKYDDMVAEYPCSPDDPSVSPETDPDFWTRAI